MQLCNYSRTSSSAIHNLHQACHRRWLSSPSYLADAAAIVPLMAHASRPSSRGCHRNCQHYHFTTTDYRCSKGQDEKPRTMNFLLSNNGFKPTTLATSPLPSTLRAHPLLLLLSSRISHLASRGTEICDGTSDLHLADVL